MQRDGFVYTTLNKRNIFLRLTKIFKQRMARENHSLSELIEQLRSIRIQEAEVLDQIEQATASIANQRQETLRAAAAAQEERRQAALRAVAALQGVGLRGPPHGPPIPPFRAGDRVRVINPSAGHI